jgi:DNA invertase Pin-like site-specific DNA recombinase
MRRAVLYLRVSTIDQTTANQERELREIAARMGCDIGKVYNDLGISGAKGRDKRPAFDALCRDASRRQFDVVIARSVDRLGRSLQDLVTFLGGCTRSALTCSYISRDSTPRRRPARRRYRCAGRPSEGKG